MIQDKLISAENFEWKVLGEETTFSTEKCFKAWEVVFVESLFFKRKMQVINSTYFFSIKSKKIFYNRPLIYK